MADDKAKQQLTIDPDEILGAGASTGGGTATPVQDNSLMGRVKRWWGQRQTGRDVGAETAPETPVERNAPGDPNWVGPQIAAQVAGGELGGAALGRVGQALPALARRIAPNIAGAGYGAYKGYELGKKMGPGNDPVYPWLGGAGGALVGGAAPELFGSLAEKVGRGFARGMGRGAGGAAERATGEAASSAAAARGVTPTTTPTVPGAGGSIVTPAQQASETGLWHAGVGSAAPNPQIWTPENQRLIEAIRRARGGGQ